MSKIVKELIADVYSQLPRCNKAVNSEKHPQNVQDMTKILRNAENGYNVWF